ncbi:hypothetical protein ABC304_10120 [Microbacterium sp. 1P10UB]|uniref:LVIVD repeat-containing protein n=1 Tax=unclassified Microbacterium TaxID=2609290 RepID=UPI0039A21B90
MSTPHTDLGELAAASEIEGFTLLAHHDLAGSGDGFQVIRQGKWLYVAHLGESDMALSVLDISDIGNPRLVRQIPHPENTRCHKVQVAGDVLIQNAELPYWAKGKPGSAGMFVYDVSDPADPRRVGFHPSGGDGVHRLWFSEAPYAHIANYLPGGRSQSYEIVDLSDPANPRSVGSWSVPGTFEEDADPWPQHDPAEFYGVHGAIPHGDRSYVSCLDAGMAILDIADPSAPSLLGHVSWSPPMGGFVHTALPLAERGLVIASSEGLPHSMQAGDKRIWVIDVREETHPVPIATFPEPRPPASSGATHYRDLPGTYGPHNLHENRPGSYISDQTIFATYSNAGLRAYDIGDPFRPEEIAHFVPPAPTGRDSSLMNDLYVDEDARVYVTDRAGGGLYILQYDGR